MIRVLVWNEFQLEKKKEKVAAIYPNGIHQTIADFLGKEEDIVVKTAWLDMETKDCGITQEMLDETDVLIWWGHAYHQYVPDEVAFMIRDAVLAGMGFIALHSAHHSKPFRYLLGTSCNLTWRESGDSELLWVVEPGHPITQGIDRYFRLPEVETYGEPFVIPTPDKLLFIGSYYGGEVFRSGCLFERGNGKIFYFQPGHESFPIFHDENVQTVIRNAVRFVAPTYRNMTLCPHIRKLGDERGYIIDQK